MHAFVIMGATKQKRASTIEALLAQWGVDHSDLFFLSVKTTIGIAAVREFERFLTLAPTRSALRVGIISDAERLTQPAQQALLKTLEEPPPRARIILEGENAMILIPTILSRCQLIALGESQEYSSEQMLDCIKAIRQMRTRGVGTRLSFVATRIKTREEAIAWVELAIVAVKNHLLSLHIAPHGTNKTDAAWSLSDSSSLLHRLLTARLYLANNVNPALVLDTVLLGESPSLRSSGG